ncbi:MAG TPA: hypothetical protein VFX96_00415 [Pyrinomonadaceae bacterium]|nr:hypothetical protein [Pyrinomonadaceae bacterium]
MTAENLSLFLLAAVVSFGVGSAITFLRRNLLKSEGGKQIAVAVGIIALSLLFLEFFLSLAPIWPESPQGLSATLAGLFGERRWVHPLLLAAVASLFNAGRVAPYCVLITRDDTHHSGYKRIYAWRRLFSVLFFTFVRYYFTLFVLYSVYWRTGSIRLMAIVTAACVMLWVGIYFFTRPDHHGQLLLYRGFSFNLSTLSYHFATVFAAGISLVIYAYYFQQPQDAAAAPGLLSSVWPYVRVLFLLSAAVFVVWVLVKIISRVVGDSLKQRHVRSLYTSLLKLGLLRVLVLASVVLPAGLAAGGAWAVGALIAVLFYALLELFVAASHARAAAGGSNMMKKYKNLSPAAK